MSGMSAIENLTFYDRNDLYRPVLEFDKISFLRGLQLNKK
jgi:hypothetical protein